MMTEWEKAQAGFLYDANYDSSGCRVLHFLYCTEDCFVIHW